MKPIIGLLLGISFSQEVALASDPVPFLRQLQRETGIVWDRPLTPGIPLELDRDPLGSLYQLWSIESSGARSHLLDQRMIGAYLPGAEIRVITLDTDSPFPRSRVDQPFTLEIKLTGLLDGFGLPDPFTRVLLEHHVSSANGVKPLPTAEEIRANTPLEGGLITSNGSTFLKFPASFLKADDPTTARGEEHFVIRTLPDSSLDSVPLASAFVRICPVASGSIQGISQNQKINGNFPTLQLTLTDLYPRSDTRLMLFAGSSATDAEGSVITAFPMNREQIESVNLEVSDLGDRISTNGTYTLALASETVFGNELLCDPVTFSVNRPTTQTKAAP